MIKKILPLLIFFISLAPACKKDQDDLDVVKQFKPDDKYFKTNIVSLHFIMETSPISRVDQAFSQLLKDQNLPTNSQGCGDGIYRGESPFDAYDYKHRVRLEIEDGAIKSIDYNEIKKGGLGKQEDNEYCREMSASGMRS